MSTRRRAREIVLQLLYEADINDTREPDSARQFIRSRMQGRKALTEFACALYQGTLENRDPIDQLLARLAKHWSIARMPAVDRNILRLAVYEFLNEPDTPRKVVINEACEIARKYGSEDSISFVNGILDGIMRELEREDRSTSAASS